MSPTPERLHTIVIGGGQAGLAVGYHLKQLGVDFAILDAHERVGGAWRRRWTSLRLFTPARYDGLPGMPFPGDPEAFPSKDEMADYLEAYAARFALPVRGGVRVDRVARPGERFVVTAGSRQLEADNVIIAMSTWQRPRTPAFARELRAGITQLHAGEYRDPSQLQEGPVLVVGAGNSGCEIALDAARAHPTFLSGRDTGHIPFRIDGLAARLLLRRLVLGVLFHHVLTVRTPLGRRAFDHFRARGMPLVRLRGSDLANAGVVRVPRVAGVRHGSPYLEDGRVLEVTNVVWCTGFDPGLSWVDVPAFRDGPPAHERGVVRDTPGIYIVGHGFIYSLSSAMLRGVGRDAEYVARHIAARAPREPVTAPAPKRRWPAAIARALALIGLIGGCKDSTAPIKTGWASVSAGSSSTCAVTVTRAAYCWGSGSAGQLGVGVAPDSLMTPAAVAGGLAFQEVSSSSFNACGRVSGGPAYCWGSGALGRLGTGSSTNALAPAAVAGSHAFISISTGSSHSCAVTASGVAYCWGSDNSGALGNGPAGSDSVPGAVAGDLVFTQVDVGIGTSCGVVADGAAYCWGSFVAIGDGGDTNTTMPARVSGGLRFQSVSVGNLSACGLTNDRRIHCWGGTGAPGVLGDGGDTVAAVPVPVASSLRFSAVDVGQTHACALAESGDVYCWGSNPSGELGTGTTGGSALTPVLVLGGHRFSALSVGPFHTCAVTVQGEAYCWGNNRFGKLGNGSSQNSDIPMRVSGLP